MISNLGRTGLVVVRLLGLRALGGVLDLDRLTLLGLCGEVGLSADSTVMTAGGEDGLTTRGGSAAASPM